MEGDVGVGAASMEPASLQTLVVWPMDIVAEGLSKNEAALPVIDAALVAPQEPQRLAVCPLEEQGALACHRQLGVHTLAQPKSRVQSMVQSLGSHCNCSVVQVQLPMGQASSVGQAGTWAPPPQLAHSKASQAHPKPPRRIAWIFLGLYPP